MTTHRHTPAKATARRLWALEATTLVYDSAQMVVGAEGIVRFPMPCFVIEHDRALVLFDTGLAPQAQDDPKAYWGETYDFFQPHVTPDMRIDRQLAKLGFDITDITHVVVSHTHHDHIGSLPLFGHAKCYIGPGEFDFADNHPPESDKYFRLETELDPARGFDWTVVHSPVHDLLGDGSLTVLHTPGHTPGSLALSVQLPGQQLVLTGDTTHLRAGMELKAPDPYDWDLDVAVQSLDILEGLKRDGANLWIAHDPEDWAHYGPLTPQE